MNLEKLVWLLDDPDITEAEVMLVDVGSHGWDEYEIVMNESIKVHVKDGKLIIPIYRKNKNETY